MIGSSQKTGGVKAHVDCSNGINITTLLAACLNALEGENADKVLTELRSNIFFKDSDAKPALTMDIVVKHTSSQDLCVVTNPSLHDGQHHLCSEHFPASYILRMLRRKIFDCLNTPSSVIGENLPNWVLKTTKCVFASVFDAFGSLEQKQAAGKHPIKHPINDSHDINALDPSLQATENEARSYIFNVVATLICLDRLGVREISYSPLPMILCSSESCSYPDALVALQRDMTINPGKTINFDDVIPLASVLSTAIGISLLRFLTGANSSGRSRITPMVLQKQGYGIDEKNRSLKVSIAVGLSEESDFSRESWSIASDVRRRSRNGQHSAMFHSDSIAHLETNLDDISGERLAFAIELLLGNGAIDAWVTPIVMKKGRPAHTLHCLCKDSGECNDNTTLDEILKLMFEHTSTLGIRIYRGVPRAKLERSMVTVTTPFMNTSRKGEVDVKVARFKNGQVVRKKAEFDHCKEIATEAGVGIQIVAGEAIKAYDNKTSET